MKKRKWLWWGVALLVLAAACFGLWFIHPYAPLALLLSLAIQLPLIYGILHVTVGSAYKDRAWERRQQYLKDGDAEEWLRGEETEARSVQYRYWSRGGRTLAALNRAEAAWAAGQKEKAAAALAAADPKYLSRDDEARSRKLLGQMTNREPYEPTFEPGR